MRERKSTLPMEYRNWKTYASTLESQLKRQEEEIKRLQEELSCAKDEAQLMIEKVPTAIYEVDFRGPCFSKVNDAMCIVMGYSREELLRMNPYDLLDETSKQKFSERVRKNIAGEPIDSSVEYKVITKTGREIYAVLNTSIRVKEGKPHNAFVIAHDVTERKLAQKALEQKNMLLALLTDAASEFIAGVDPIEKLDDFFSRAGNALGLEVYVQYNLSQDGTYLQLGRLSGFPDRYVKVLSRLELGQAVCGTVAKIRQPIYVNHVQEQNDRMTRLIRKLGIGAYACHPLMVGDRLLGTLSFGSRQHTQFDPETIAFLRTFSNMVAEAVARKQAETALQESEQLERLRVSQLEAVLEALPVGMTLTDEAGGVVMANKAFEQLWGNPRPKTDSVQDYQAYKAWWADSGKELAPEEWASAQAVQAGKTVVGQILEIKRFDGSRVYVHNSASPVRDHLGRIVGSAVAIQDITRLREAEQLLKDSNITLEQSVEERTRELKDTYLQVQELARDLEKSLSKERYMRQQLIQSEKYAALTRLVASVAHEINNPLQTIQNCIFLLQDAVPPGEAHDVINIISAEGNRMSSLVQQLRDTYRPSAFQIEDFNVVECLTQALNLVAPQLRDNKIEWRIKSEKKELIIRGVPDQIKQVFINIILNAIDSMEASGGKLIATVTAPEGQARITFQDTGVGIMPENLEKVFEPFFTTKVKGTGLGLAICYEIIRDHQGAINVESTPSEGSTFSISLPVNRN